ncbi:hypothetical protein Y032_0006g2835 [Ancylostoma ceylanicum]|nr:hypothetical protein Y032_0006g2835 [Ancylostoma ceylanicum]
MSRVLVFFIVGLAAIPRGQSLLERGLFGHPAPPPCGLPAFTDELPADAQKKMKEIWKDYKEGEKCYHEHGLTRELMDSLPKEVRQEIHKGAFLPPILKKQPKDIQDQFIAIIDDKSIPFEEKSTKMHELAQKEEILGLERRYAEGVQRVPKQDGRAQKEPERAGNLSRKSSEDRLRVLFELPPIQAEKLSPEAKEAYEKISKLEKEKHEILHKLSESAQEELFALYKERQNKFPKPL